MDHNIVDLYLQKLKFFLDTILIKLKALKVLFYSYKLFIFFFNQIKFKLFKLFKFNFVLFTI
jgi:hypothetical protein